MSNDPKQPPDSPPAGFPPDIQELARRAMEQREANKQKEKALEQRAQAALLAAEERRMRALEGLRARAEHSFNQWRDQLQAARLPLLEIAEFVRQPYSKARALWFPEPLPRSGHYFALWLNTFHPHEDACLKIADEDSSGNGSGIERLTGQDLLFLEAYFSGEKAWNAIRQHFQHAATGQRHRPPWEG